jgi:hypothetical protein
MAPGSITRMLPVPEILIVSVNGSPCLTRARSTAAEIA